MTTKPILNIGILAHVDAGKTSLTEQILFEAGTLKNKGDVNKGTAVSDFLEVEKQRGISVIASHITFDYKDIKFNIIDTPGHADFISEVERSLIAVDVVLMVISAADGVQAQTKVLWKLIEKLGLPRIIIINKIDRIGVSIEDVMSSINTELKAQTVCIQTVESEGTDNVAIQLMRDSEGLMPTETIVESVANVNDDLLDKYLQGEEFSSEYLFKAYNQGVNNMDLFPVLFSVAKTGLGIPYILDELISLFANQEQSDGELSAVVFKLEHHKDYGKLAYLRVFDGSIKKKQLVYNKTRDIEEKVNLIKAVFSNKLMDTDMAQSGEIVAITGFSETMVGDVLGHGILPRTFDFDNQAVLTVEVKAVDDNDYFKLSEALAILDIEDPRLQFSWYKDEREYHIKINGWIQIQILEQILKDRFSLETKFESPQVIYKETPSKAGFGKGDYTMPKPCWAVIKLKIEPAERGSGIIYSSKVGVNDALLRYQKEVERTIPRALEQGIKGWEVTDLKITLETAQDHVMHSRAGDFVIVTPMAVMNGLQELGTDLLEPIMAFEINAPDDLLGQISGDLHKMRAEFNQPMFDGNDVRITGKIPAATSLEYPVQLASRSGGKANIQMQFCCYKKVDVELGNIREYKGISPLDRAKYILKVRNAIQ